MVAGQVIGAAGNTFIESAKAEDGLVNQLFKIGILIGGLIVLVIAIAILVFLFSLDLGGIFDGITAPFKALFTFWDASTSVITGVASSFGFGQKGINVNYRNGGSKPLLLRFFR